MFTSLATGEAKASGAPLDGARRSPAVIAAHGLPHDASLVVPRRPGSLAVGPHGVLYMVDPGRDEILERLADGKFVVVAGTGKVGFSGDGGPALDAKLDLTHFSGIAATPGGALYIGDTGNKRIREVLPDGIIKTVAGNGTNGVLTKPERATAAAIGDSTTWWGGLSLSQNGQLYIAASTLVELSVTGVLSPEAGNAALSKTCRVNRNPACEADINAPTDVAVDGLGDVFVTNSYEGLYEVTKSGALRYLRSLLASAGCPG